MIPKVIHYCWLSDDPYPEKIKRCMDSWKRVLPDYEFVHWNFDRFPRGKSKWVDQAFDAGKYAFAADYIRLYALYNYGGIYLDTDVEVVKPFDDLLVLPYFFGMEMETSPIEAATMGCEKGCSLIKDVLDTYIGKSFVKPDGTFDELPLPNLFKPFLGDRYALKMISSIDEFDYDQNVINVFPITWFSPKEWHSGGIRSTPETYSIHQFYASWLGKKDRFVMWISRNIHPRLGHWMSYFLRNPLVIARNVRAAMARRFA